ncbi:MAG: HAMP domain-containing histidine kinase [Acidobacteria bacterium]|nr:HAMP domain-containing histidine kinase [Acidobacteriota bacterium]
MRNRLIAVFLAATLAPLAATLWLALALLDRSLGYASTRELDEISRSLEATGRELYQRARQELQRQAAAGRGAIAGGEDPEAREFRESGEGERFALSGEEGGRLRYFVRRGGVVEVYSAEVGAPLGRLLRQYRDARELVQAARNRDLRRGFTYTYALLAAAVWLAALALLIYLAHRISRPIQELTAGLGRLAAGDLGARVAPARKDELGEAGAAFNHMAERLEQSTEKLVYLSQVASWQALARKMAHELKNSLTPIRLAVEEMVARYRGADQKFVRQAAQIVVEEIETLERRVRAFSEFSSEPPVECEPVDVNALVAERVALLAGAHPEVKYEVRSEPGLPVALADQDLLKGVLRNLLENAAEAAGSGGRVLAVTSAAAGAVAIDVHDSGPGLSAEARRTLFEPAISFKKGGMGLGLSIARKGALRLGGDVQVLESELAGAAFRVLLPLAGARAEGGLVCAKRAS